MPILDPSYVADRLLMDVVNRLADTTIGFNAQLTLTVAGSARYKANAGFLTQTKLVFPTNFVGTSPNVILAPISIDDWIKNSNVTTCGNTVLMQIYTINAINQQVTKGLVFDGLVNIGIDCHVLWGNQNVVYDFDAPMSAVENTIFTIFNTKKPPYQYWSPGVIYNGRLSVPARSQITSGGTGWMQLSTMQLQSGLQAA